jgi:predicted methyltransferase
MGGAVPGIMMNDAAPAVTAASANIVAALVDPRRPEADAARDAQRHPAEIMAFADVRPGQVIADVGPGGGYYTRLFAAAASPDGRVYGVIRPAQPNATQRAAIWAVAESGAYPNLRVTEQDAQNWAMPESLDLIFISQIYHDFHLPRFAYDIAAVNRSLFGALKPGGALVVIDHAAIAGSDASVADTLHRIDQAQVVRELTAAGFVLEAESDVLRNPEDNRTLRVFEGNIRGRTDQFVLRFRKPGN